MTSWKVVIPVRGRAPGNVFPLVGTSFHRRRSGSARMAVPGSRRWQRSGPGPHRMRSCRHREVSVLVSAHKGVGDRGRTRASRSRHARRISGTPHLLFAGTPRLRSHSPQHRANRRDRESDVRPCAGSGARGPAGAGRSRASRMLREPCRAHWRHEYHLQVRAGELQAAPTPGHSSGEAAKCVPGPDPRAIAQTA